jgi:hypothetical protein
MLDPVEDLVRRTFAVRAEDVAPGDGADWPAAAMEGPGPGRGRGPRPRWPSRPLLLAAAVLAVVLAAAGVVALAGGDGDDSSGDLATGGAEASVGRTTAALVIAPRDLLVALQDERNMASLTLIGATETIATPVADNAQARSNTDLAVASLESLLAEAPGGSRDLPLLDALGGLEQLRADIDADVGPADFGNLEAAQAAFDRYSEITAGVLSAHLDFVRDIGDAPLREGGEAYVRGLRLEDLTARLVRTALLTGIAPTQDTDKIQRLADLLATTEAGLAELEELTEGTAYQDATTAVADGMRTSGLLEQAHLVLDSQLDVVTLIEAGETMTTSGWPTYLDQVEQILAEQG